ncbi:MAG TPA: hypothetical protein VIU13_02935 [Chryseolinea sp.]
MKFALTITLLIITFSVMGQGNIPYEQIAFDFYKDKILKDNPPKSTLTLWIDLETKDYLFWGPSCLTEFKLKSGDSVKVNSSGRTTLECQPDKRFKTKKLGTGTYPRVYLTVSFSNKPDQHVVTIVETYKHEGITYHIEMDDTGKVKNWCKGGWIE